MSQALMIVVDNAARFSPPDTRVELRASLSDEYLELTTSDHGPGIPEDLRPYIFDRFRRGDPARGRRHAGAGLGLAIALAIVEGHGGSIDVGTWSGGGARVTIRVPLAGPVAADRGAS
jgi:signal transduction histidine kinase